MGYAPSESFPELIETMKKAAAAFDAAGVPVLLGGGLAAWARGGPPTDHDVDFFVREEHAEAGLAALEEAGMRSERPPEGWLLKAWDGETLVDLIFRPSGGAVDDEMFARATDLEVMARALPVASIDDVLATKVLALNEQAPDFRAVLEIARCASSSVPSSAKRSNGRMHASAAGATEATPASRASMSTGRPVRDRAVSPRAGRLGPPPVAGRRLAVRRRVHDARRAPANRARVGGRGRRGGWLVRVDDDGRVSRSTGGGTPRV